MSSIVINVIYKPKKNVKCPLANYMIINLIIPCLTWGSTYV